jgi:uncharacterized protein (UPF0128 family)
MKTELNYKQKQVIEYYVATGMCNFGAEYKAIYTNASAATARVNAHRLFRLDRAQRYLNQVIKEQQENLNVTKEELVSNLRFIMENTKTANPNAAIKAIETLSKMMGYHAPTKTETDLTVHGEQPLFGDIINEENEIQKDDE